VLATMLAGHVAALRLVGRDHPDGLRRLEQTRLSCLAAHPDTAQHVSVHTTLDAVHDADIVMVATSSPESKLIGPDTVRRGAIVSCASVPSNLSAAFHDHLDDYLVFDGGLARLPGGQVVDCVGLPSGGLAFGCFSETVLLGLAGTDRSFARGAITPEQVRYVLQLAREHQFTLGELTLNGTPHRTGALT
jgi:predicted amino acid dehydrogenase